MTSSQPREGTENAVAGNGKADATGKAGPEPLFFERAELLEAWLEQHHGDRTELWLKIAKKSSGIASVTAPEVVDAALCSGWIDGQRKSLDEVYYLQRISPRRAGSAWSLVNVRKAEALIAAGRMREPGLVEVRAAREDGRWESAYPSQKEATVPADLAAALAADPRAAERFERLGRTDRYLVILELLRARTPKLRAARLDRLVTKLGSGESTP
ncbi:YdeI family protein [Streptomyces sp. QL37]|uniref:YdeI/OmpD-associated family protein n=1 Tax=Streptomyces sp. QL37 TaxID=2093747 RepID=UPI000CF2D568|nr:YdeI/OmpD-associated family protein [Streptomyces sp. QL37]PPQ61675.1 OmdA domain containing protein [Streptomyces sp. QL37]